MSQPISFEQIIAMLSRTFAELESQALQQDDFSDLSMKQIVYLETIAELGRPRSSDLAKRFGVSRPTVTAQVARLIQGGYVEKAPSEKDKRSFFITLTEKGRAIHEAHAKIHCGIAQHFSRVLDEAELGQLATMLHKVIKDAFIVRANETKER